jgi:hypothetical protein
MRAIEVQGVERGGGDKDGGEDDEELKRSIGYWKMQWADVDRRARARRKGRGAAARREGEKMAVGGEGV